MRRKSASSEWKFQFPRRGLLDNFGPTSGQQAYSVRPFGSWETRRRGDVPQFTSLPGFPPAFASAQSCAASAHHRGDCPARAKIRDCGIGAGCNLGQHGDQPTDQVENKDRPRPIETCSKGVPTFLAAGAAGRSGLERARSSNLRVFPGDPTTRYSVFLPWPYAVPAWP